MYLCIACLRFKVKIFYSHFPKYGSSNTHTIVWIWRSRYLCILGQGGGQDPPELGRESLHNESRAEKPIPLLPQKQCSPGNTHTYIDSFYFDLTIWWKNCFVGWILWWMKKWYISRGIKMVSAWIRAHCVQPHCIGLWDTFPVLQWAHHAAQGGAQ